MATPGENGDARPSERRRDGIPETMKALQYSGPEKFAVVQIPVPEIGDDDVLVKISACGVCGTDLHYHKGEFLAKWPLIPGHEAVGTIVALGRNIHHLPLSTRVTADPLLACHACHHCTNRRPLLCTNITAFGGNVPGGFAEYCRYPATQVHAIGTVPDLEAVLIEPAACALHGVERMAIKPGSRALVFGAGPTGCLIVQLMRMNGAAHITLASLPGPKLDKAQSLGIADAYLPLPPTDPSTSFSALQDAHPHGFDIVVEATGAPSVLESALPLVSKGGTLVVYGVYNAEVKISWSPFLIWEREISIVASFCSMGHVTGVMPYVESGRLGLGGVVDRVFGIEEWEECMRVVGGGECVKAAIVFT